MSRRALHAIAAALLCAVAFGVVWLLAFHTGHGRSADFDVTTRLSSYAYYRPELTSALNGFAWFCNPLPYAALCAVVLAAGFLRFGGRGTVLLTLVLLIPNAAAQVLKEALASDRDGTRFIAHIDAAAWPSGHATASLVLAGAAVMVAPAVLRPLVAGAGAVFALLMATAVVALGWHYASDTLGGWALAGVFVALGYGLMPEPRPSAARLPERLFGAVGAPRQDEQQV